VEAHSLLRALTALIAALGAILALAAPAGAVPCETARCATFSAPGATGPVVAGSDGNLWFLGDGFVGRMDLRGGVTRFPAPVGPGSDLTAGPDGALYFTAPGLVGRMGTDGQFTLTRSGLNGAGAIATTADGTLWLGGAGAVMRLRSADVVDRAVPDVSRLATAQVAASRSVSGPSSLVRGPDGALWFAQSGRAAIGRLAPDGTVTDYPLPPEFGDQIGGIVAGPDGGIWFTAPKGFRVGRLSTRSGNFSSYRTSWNPYTITAGPSHSIWFAMTDSGRWSIVRMVPAGYMSFWQVPGTVRGLGVGPDGAVYITKDSSIERLLPFLGAYPIRSRNLPVSPFTQAISMRLLCPMYDLIYCAGNITVRHGQRVVGTAPFSQRAFDAPATRMVLNAYGRGVVRRLGRVPVTATLVQHDAGGSWRTSSYDFALQRRSR
jgi:virginiamycin B lyase